jgi:flagellar biosynthesis GTPase FlhF
MSKIRQAELALAIQHERELREAEKTAFNHERELRAVYDQHERELRLQAEAAVEKARQLQFEIYEHRLDQMNEFREQLTTQATTFLTIDRFEREHQALGDRLDERWERIQQALRLEENVTMRQTVSAEDILEYTRQSVESSNTNRRWLIGLAVGLVFSLLGLFITLFSLLTHEGAI